jgi:hypothetical protein
MADGADEKHIATELLGFGVHIATELLGFGDFCDPRFEIYIVCEEAGNDCSKVPEAWLSASYQQFCSEKSFFKF